MESYGEILRAKREEKQIDIETAARETVILRKYIEAMEKEREQDFPGEPYLIGFLKNYSEYLGVSVDDVLKLYNAKKIQEMPVPTQLLEKKRPKWIVPFVITTVVIALTGIGLWLYFIILDVPGKIEAKKAALAESKKSHTYQVTQDISKPRLYKGDQLKIPSAENEEKFDFVTVSGCLGKLVLDTPSGKQVIDFGENRSIDINGDGNAEINVYLEDVSDKSDDYGAKVRIFLTNERLEKTAVAASLEDIENEQIKASTAQSKPGKILFDSMQGRTAFPFSVSIVFRGACIFRYKVDSDDYVESYYRANETLTLSAKNGFRFWMSNSDAVSIRIIADSTQKDFDTGTASEVKVVDIKWVFEDNTYKIAAIDLD